MRVSFAEDKDKTFDSTRVGYEDQRSISLFEILVILLTRILSDDILYSQSVTYNYPFLITFEFSSQILPSKSGG